MARLTEALAGFASTRAPGPSMTGGPPRLAAARRAEPVRPLLTALAEAEAAAGAGPRRAAPPDPRTRRRHAGRSAAGRGDGAGRGSRERDAASLQHLADAGGGPARAEAALAALDGGSQRAARTWSRALEAARGGAARRGSPQLEGGLAQATAAAAGGLDAARAAQEAITVRRDAAARPGRA